MQAHFQHDRVLQALEELSSESEQRRLWLSDGSSGEWSSPDEAQCGVFDDTGLWYVLPDRTGLSIEFGELVLALGSLLRSVNFNVDLNELIASDEMKSIRELAEKVHIVLKRDLSTQAS